MSLAKAVSTSTGLISYDATEKALEARGALEGVIHGHFNAVAGRNEFELVDTLFTVGRPAPGPYAVERYARALFCDDDTPLHFSDGTWSRKAAGHWTKGGEVVVTQRDAHPDDRIDAIRQQIVTAGLMQSDRSRGVQRRPDQPVTWYVVTNEPLPIAVDELMANDELLPTKWQVAVARGLFPKPTSLPIKRYTY